MANVPRWRWLVLLLTMSSMQALQAAECEFTVANEWNTGFTASITITNTDNSEIEGWSVGLLFPDGSTIAHIWNADRSGSNPYDLTNKPYNARIASGQSTQFGFNGAKAVSGAPAPTPLLSGVCGDVVQENRPPIAEANVSPLSGTVPFSVTFDATASSDEDGDSLTYLWDFGNGDTDSSATVDRTFTTAGDYTVSLTVNDGTVDSTPVTVVVQAAEPPPGQAYLLDATRSSLYFVSTKKTHILENHTFTEMSGAITDQGQANLVMNLDSIESGIDIRNSRMRDFLFETATFAQATVTLAVDLNQIEAMAVGESLVQSIAPDLDLHGITVTLNTQVRVTKLSTTTLMVQNLEPMLINAADFALVDGIEQLRNLAGLNVISYVVPTNFTLVFSAQ